MSYRVLDWVEQHSASRKGEHAVLVALANMANDDGYCWPKVETIAQRTGLSVRTVKYKIKALEALGELVVERQPGRGLRTSFRIIIGGKGAESAPFPRKKVQSTTEKGAKYDTKKVQSTTEKGADYDRKIGVGDPSDPTTEESSVETEEDFAATFRTDLARIVGRALTDDERKAVDDACVDDVARERMGRALTQLNGEWTKPNGIYKRHDVANWLRAVLLDLEGRDWREREALRQRYVRDEYPAPVHEPRTLDDLRFEHAIDPEPLPPHTQLWHETMESLRLELPRATVEQWLHTAEASAGSDDVLQVTLRGKTPIPERLHRVCERALRSIAGRHVALEFVQRGDE